MQTIVNASDFQVANRADGVAERACCGPSALHHNARDLTGQRFGRWAAIAPSSERRDAQSGVFWLCRCDCGTERPVLASRLRGGFSQSCGCLAAERTAARAKHRLCTSPEYFCWKNLKARCLNPKEPAYANYGGRGIRVCQRWRESFLDFLADMGPRPSPTHSIDRINVNGDYAPENCRWATHIEQSNNTRRTTKITFRGRTLSAAQWSREVGIGRTTIRLRIEAGWSVDDALTLGPDQGRSPIGPMGRPVGSKNKRPRSEALAESAMRRAAKALESGRAILERQDADTTEARP